MKILDYFSDKFHKSWLVIKKYPWLMVRNPYLLKKFFSILIFYGPYQAMQNAYDFLQLTNLQKSGSFSPDVDDGYCPTKQYNDFIKKHQLVIGQDQSLLAEAERWDYQPLISIVMPVYDVDIEVLSLALKSVQNQIYRHWQLCLANGSSRQDIKELLDYYAAEDEKIKVIHLEKNKGISENSNAALGLAKGEFVGLLDHDDELTINALWEVVKLLQQEPKADVIYSDEDKINSLGEYCLPHFKPDWCPDLLLSMQYIGHFVVLRKRLIAQVGGFRSQFDGSQDHDLLLRITELTKNISHIPKVLYHWRMTPSSTASGLAVKPHCYWRGKKAVYQAAWRRGDKGYLGLAFNFRYYLRYKFDNSTLASIIIPTKDQADILDRCVRSIIKKTSYQNYEIIIVNNNSLEDKTKKILADLQSLSSKIKLIDYPDEFNYSKINNYAASFASGEVLVFLNNDTEVISKTWLTAIMEQALRKEVGAVGCKLLFPNQVIQHAGVFFTNSELIHAFYGQPNYRSYFDYAEVIRNYSAVTGACLGISQKVFSEIGGFDEKYQVPFSDIDLCFSLRQKGYLIVYTPLAQLYHLESATRGFNIHPKDKERFLTKWQEVLSQPDPYYNVNLDPSSIKAFCWKGY